MKCPHCGSDNVESNKFCRSCGEPMEPITKLLDSSGSPDPTGHQSKGPSNNQQDKVGVDKEAQDEIGGPNIDLRAIGQSSVKCAVILGLSALIVHFVTTFFAGHFKISSNVNTAKNDPTVHLIQAIMAGLFLVFLFTPMGAPRKGKVLWSKIARDTFHQFLKGWSAIWVSWLLLYLYFGIILLIANDASEVQNVSLQVTVDFLNVANSAAFFYVFLVLDMPSVSTKDRPHRNREFQRAFIAVASTCFLIFLFSGFSRFNHVLLGPYLSGLLVAISMAYVFGRLDSHYMNVNRWMLAPLYLYAVIQVSGPDLIDYSGISKEVQQKVFFATVLLLKIYLFIVVTYWLQNGSFEKYFNTASNYIEDRRSKKEASSV
jgi:zinc-ribbon domain